MRGILAVYQEKTPVRILYKINKFYAIRDAQGNDIRGVHPHALKHFSRVDCLPAAFLTRNEAISLRLEKARRGQARRPKNVSSSKIRHCKLASCRKSFEAVRSNQHYCSRDCCNAGYIEKRRVVRRARRREREAIRCRRSRCRNTFVPRNSRQVYCSKECSSKDRLVTTKICRKECAADNCQRKFKPLRRNHRFCSEGCSSYHSKMSRRKSKSYWGVRVCALPGCEVEFSPRNKRRMCCSKKHYDSLRNLLKKKPLRNKTCAMPLCGKKFTTRITAQKFCSERCRKKSGRLNRGEQKILGVIRCGYRPCGKRFRKTNSQQRYCSPKCGRKQLYKVRNSTVFDNVCGLPTCRKRFKSKGNPKKYCSNRCKMVGSWQVRKSGKEKAACSYFPCGREFEPVTGQKYCSKTCASRDRRLVKD